VVLDLKQPFARMKIDARMSSLDAAFGAYEARALALKASVVTDPLHLVLDELAFASPGGGKLAMGAELAGTAVKARVKFDRFTTTSYVPAALRKLGAGKLTGRIALAGDFGEKKKASVGPVDLTLVRTKGRGLPAHLQIKGQATATDKRISTSEISV